MEGRKERYSGHFTRTCWFLNKDTWDIKKYDGHDKEELSISDMKPRNRSLPGAAGHDKNTTSADHTTVSSARSGTPNEVSLKYPCFHSTSIFAPAVVDGAKRPPPEYSKRPQS